MPNIQGLTLIMTRACNAECGHCGFASTPVAGGTMTLAQVTGYIDEALKVGTLQMVGITGGEPLLFPEMVEQVISYAARYGLGCELVSNGFWANSVGVARERFKTLRSLGLTKYVTSLDDFHAKFISPEKVRNSIAAALSEEISVTVKITETPEATINRQWAQEFLDDVWASPQLQHTVTHPVRSGRGSSLKGALFEQGQPQENLSGYCENVMKFPAVTVEGHTYPCCGFEERARYLGNAQERPLSGILAEMQGNLLLHLIGSIGPLEVLKLAKPEALQAELLDFTNPCEVCNYLYDSEVRCCVASLLKSMTRKLAMGTYVIHA